MAFDIINEPANTVCFQSYAGCRARDGQSPDYMLSFKLLFSSCEYKRIGNRGFHLLKEGNPLFWRWTM